MTKFWHKLTKLLHRYFMMGVLTLAPLAITIWAVITIVTYLDNLVLPHLLRFLGVESELQLPFVGALFTLLSILACGILAHHFFGWELVRLAERLLDRVPVARNIYRAVRQLFESLVRADFSTSVRRVVLVEYPRRGAWAVGFTTGPASPLLAAQLGATKLTNVFVPTTPNPTSGFFLVVPEDDLRVLDISVERAFKLVMSAGLVSPENEERGLAGNFEAWSDDAPGVRDAN